MEVIVPTISTGTAGPLGVLHLPRLWLKTLLKAYGRLPEGYKAVQPGFDSMVLEGLKVDPQKARDFLLTEKPTYLQFEDWVRNSPGVDLSAENIAAVNQTIRERKKGPESRAKMLAQNGLPPEAPIDDSIMLNNLDDWREVELALRG